MDKRTATLVGESIAHAMHDTWFGVAPVLLASMSSELALKNSDIGLALLFYNAVSSITQPIFGRLSERIGGRVLATSAIIWTSIMFMAAVFAPAKWVIFVVLALAGIGSGAFHPQGTANSTASGGGRFGATAASVFFLGGTLGASLTGSALGGLLIDSFGRRSLVIVAFVTISVALLVVRRLVPHELAEREDGPKPVEHSLPRQGKAFYVPLAILLIGLALRALTQNTIQSYVPKFEQDLGSSPATYGLVLSAFLALNALGGVVGSYLADRIGFRGVLVGSLALCGMVMYGYLALPGAWGYVCFILSGFFFGPSHTLYLVSGQRRFPGRMATVAGFMLGFTFVSGSGGAWLMGLIGDQQGLRAILAALPVILLISAVCAAIAVPGKRAVAVAEAPRP